MRTTSIFDQPVNRIAENFNFRADQRGAWHVPEGLYEQFLDLFENLVIFHAKASAVIQDKEHALLIEMGRRHFHLPPKNFLKEDLLDLAKKLSSFDAVTVRQTAKGDVELSMHQIEGFFRSFSKGQEVVEKIAVAFSDAQYMEYFRYLRNVAEAPYRGPTCISEANSLYFKLRYAHKKQIDFLVRPH